MWYLAKHSLRIYFGIVWNQKIYSCIKYLLLDKRLFFFFSWRTMCFVTALFYLERLRQQHFTQLSCFGGHGLLAPTPCVRGRIPIDTSQNVMNAVFLPGFPWGLAEALTFYWTLQENVSWAWVPTQFTGEPPIPWVRTMNRWRKMKDFAMWSVWPSVPQKAGDYYSRWLGFKVCSVLFLGISVFSHHGWDTEGYSILCLLECKTIWAQQSAPFSCHRSIAAEDK